jgi:hypothetical protein
MKSVDNINAANPSWSHDCKIRNRRRPSIYKKIYTIHILDSY